MTTVTLDDLKSRQQRTWSSGDYGKIAWPTVPLADTLCDAVDVRPGSAVLDVACGTGHVAMHVPPAPGVNPPTLWGTEERVRELFGDRVAELNFTTAGVTERFPSPEFFADFFIEDYGPTLKAAEALPGEAERRAYRDDLVSLAAQHNTSDRRHRHVRLGVPRVGGNEGVMGPTPKEVHRGCIGA